MMTPMTMPAISPVLRGDSGAGEDEGLGTLTASVGKIATSCCLLVTCSSKTHWDSEKFFRSQSMMRYLPRASVKARRTWLRITYASWRKVLPRVY